MSRLGAHKAQAKPTRPVDVTVSVYHPALTRAASCTIVCNASCKVPLDASMLCWCGGTSVQFVHSFVPSFISSSPPSYPF
ncbi:hypothetical protein FIBSPDRAFT_851683 [Athelia psychrophila]|uniref:Uncharacterized protein n=1 Tax=Athelia psychrophila TaxID=1759441 RepID=A0A166SCQ8_9AGAM|nr:hypothetical protein FIBSPDRAFT_878263 [Fibularhizoctonia sp. CBS 109695]KZP29296.1 hypothetical protein FIBSPDRAFT_851683 [Fibularhizoctonia sp. CBS 109695]